MEKQQLQERLKSVAQELSAEATREGLKGVFHFDVYDDQGHGRVCSFEMNAGRVTWWTWTESVAVAEWPLGLVLSSGDGETRKLWVSERVWRRAA